MPIVDGLTSTKMIRSFEKTHSSNVLSQRAAFNGRVPVFAVSASLVEKDRRIYVDGGFDGWILKPIDFKRLNVLLAGIMEKETRKGALYQPGQWERGGWFAKRQPNVFAAMTAPSGKPPVAHPPGGSERPLVDDDPFDDPISKEQARLDNPETGAVHPDSMPQNSGESGNLQTFSST